MSFSTFLKKYKIKSIIIAIIIASTGGAGYVSTNTVKQKNYIPEIEPNKQYEVIKVVDGDTFNVKVDGYTVKVRLIGVDTPETVDPRKVVQCFGKEASSMAKQLLTKHTVTLDTDPTQEKSDKYGRLLAYVHNDEDIFINSYMIEKGYAHEYTYNIPYKYQKEFKDLEKQAREGKLGLWGELCNGVK